MGRDKEDELTIPQEETLALIASRVASILALEGTVGVGVVGLVGVVGIGHVLIIKMLAHYSFTLRSPSLHIPPLFCSPSPPFRS